MDVDIIVKVDQSAWRVFVLRFTVHSRDSGRITAKEAIHEVDWFGVGVITRT